MASWASAFGAEVMSAARRTNKAAAASSSEAGLRAPHDATTSLPKGRKSGVALGEGERRAPGNQGGGRQSVGHGAAPRSVIDCRLSGGPAAHSKDHQTMAGSWSGCLRTGNMPLRLPSPLRLAVLRIPSESVPAGGWGKLSDSVTEKAV